MIGLFASLVMSQPAHGTTAAQAFQRSLPRAGAIVRPMPPTKKRPQSLGVKTTAASVFVADLATGSVLYTKDPHHVQPIASLTKLVTAMVFLDQRPDLTKMIIYEPGDFDHQGEDVFKPGDQLSYEDVLRSMLIGSVNASANAIARTTLGKQAFVAAMNQKVKDLGLQTPAFVDPSGIDPRDRSDAADVAAIISTATGYPEVRKFTEMPEVDVHASSTNNTYRVLSTNLLLNTYLNKKPFTIISAKTGSLPEAGYCMAQVTRNADGHQIVAVELGNDNHFARFQDIKALTTWAFDTYEWK